MQFESLPTLFRSHGLKADIATLLLVRKSIDKGLINNLGDMYVTLRSLVSRDPEDYGPFTIAFYDYFLDIKIEPGEELHAAVGKSDSFNKWRSENYPNEKEYDAKKLREWVDEYVDEIHTTSYDIHQVNKGSFRKSSDPEVEGHSTPREDEEVARVQSDDMENGSSAAAESAADDGGRGDGQQNAGNSPREGGQPMGGGSKRAGAILKDRRYYPVDVHATISDYSFDIALSALEGIQEETTEEVLDVPLTIEEGVKLGGLFLPYEKQKKEKKIRVLLMIDNGGASMIPYVKLIRKLFSKMKIRFSHDLQTYYYHNTIYGGLWSDEKRTKFETIEKFVQKDKRYKIFIIGDADMAPYEVTKETKEDWLKVKEHFKTVVWLNPVRKKRWFNSDTIHLFRQMIPMFALSPAGITEAVEYQNRPHLHRQKI